MRRATSLSERATIFRAIRAHVRRSLHHCSATAAISRRRSSLTTSKWRRRADRARHSTTAATSTDFSELDGDLELGDHAGARRDRALGPDAAWSQHPELPVAWRGVEGEPAVLAEWDLCDELAVGVQQPRVPGGHRRASTRHMALDDGLVPGSPGHLD